MRRPRRLRFEHARFSPFASRVSVTLVAAYDVTRLHMLDGLCGSWGGHLSAAVYQVRAPFGSGFGSQDPYTLTLTTLDRRPNPSSQVPHASRFCSPTSCLCRPNTRR